MSKEEIINTITEALKAKLIGTTHCKNRTIIDVRVDICESLYYDEILINVLAATKKGKTKTWMQYHIE
jgi:hypothetical protein